eukprot:GHVL01012594.1.p1 GENE.GHVL01012594.1~~GHVL01012594.1.p1  ORF type:complete len:135 (+),score=35.25 GHVL01012594.1:323-727(+)
MKFVLITFFIIGSLAKRSWDMEAVEAAFEEMQKFAVDKDVAKYTMEYAKEIEKKIEEFMSADHSKDDPIVFCQRFFKAVLNTQIQKEDCKEMVIIGESLKKLSESKTFADGIISIYTKVLLEILLKKSQDGTDL